MSRTHGQTQKSTHIKLMGPNSIIDEIESQLDEEGLIDVSILEQIPIIIGGKHARTTDAYGATDKEFIDWYLKQIESTSGDVSGTITNLNRLKLRMMMLGCLRYISDVSNHHWRDPRPVAKVRE
jgi:RNA-binding protein YhbY